MESDELLFPRSIGHLQPLTPISFLERSATVYADRLAVSDRGETLTYSQLYDRCRHLAGALGELGVTPGERVAYLSPNTHALLEGHFGVPGAGAILVAMNTRLAPPEHGYILDHSGATVLVYDRTLASEARQAADQALHAIELIESGGPDSDYETLLRDSEPQWVPVADESAPLAINYTSGTTGRPKGVVYHHRGAYLQALAMAYHANLRIDSVYLWTLPMFHTNGWCFPWAVTASGAVHRCLPRVDPVEVWSAIHDEGVTHLCAAPTVLSMLSEHPDASGGSSRPLSVMTGGAPPSPTLIDRLTKLNIDVIHLYGLTETFGPAAICDWKPEWSALDGAQQARLKARQGVGNVISSEVRVVDSDGADVPADGETLGEIAVTGNNVMSGYFRDPEATARAIPDGWFRTGDLAVKFPDGYVEIRDRKKDIIISGGENISSVEVEQALVAHPAVFEAAVVAVPDDKWGEVPLAWVELRQGAEVSPSELIDFLREHLAGFKVPREFRFAELPRTSTGKIQKHRLRDRA